MSLKFSSMRAQLTKCFMSRNDVRGRLYGLSLLFLVSAIFPFWMKSAARKISVDLTGQVTSTDEGPMEGVLVSAKKTGATVTVTVITDDQGRYSFPTGRLDPGHYDLRVRADGYDLDAAMSVDISAGKPAAANLKLRKTSDLAAQLSNAEWMASFPGTDEQKISIQICTHCHTLERIARSNHDTDEFRQVIDRMFRHSPESFPLMVQPDPPGRAGGELSPEQRAQQQENRRKMAEYLSTLNLSSASEWSYPLKTFPRPKGTATHAIITEYDLPKRTRQPHDVIVDSQGTVWYASFGEPILGKLDPKTGKITEYPIPVLKPGAINGNLDVEFDEEQNIWIAMTFQAAVAKFDRKTEKFTVYSLPPELDADYRELTFVGPAHSHVDGKVWITDSGTYTILRLDTASGKFDVFEPFPRPRPLIYQVVSDSHNNAYFTVMGREHIGRIDAKTGEISFYQIPTARSAPRRGMIDSQGRLWFGENRGNKIGMFDTNTQKFQEWAVPFPYYFPYDVTLDRNGEVWAVTEFSDSVLRLDPGTGQYTSYMLPRETNMRRAFVDNSIAPVAFWVGNTHRASIAKIETLDGPTGRRD
ncbi:MAG TPA: carboxypeptidase regulatory-like domain-containing protein [Verrucomicrobiae bacterium]|nr:carboxypeptidase regulatory-like domain-containing protein [Verrucomicrobiae bacterium]